MPPLTARPSVSSIGFGFLFVVCLTAACLSGGFPAMAANGGKPLGMVTGPATGTYIQIGKDIAEMARKDGIAIEVKPSLGSIDNLRRMSTRGENAGLGIVQSDVLGFLKRSQSTDSQTVASKLRMIAPLYGEEIHLLARDDIAGIADLEGKKVVVGTEGSGTMLTATNLFALLGVHPGKLYKVAPPEGVVAVMTGQADAVIFVGGKPVKLFKNLESLGHETGKTAAADAEALARLHFLPLEDARLREDYTPATITTGDYDFVKSAVPTVAVRAVLVSYDFTLKNEPYYHARCAELGRLGKGLRQRVDQLRSSGHPKWKEVDLGMELGLWQRDACAWPAVQASNAATAPAKKEVDAAGATSDPSVQPAMPVFTARTPPVDSRTQRLQLELGTVVSGTHSK